MKRAALSELGTLEERREALRLWVDLWESPAFQGWVKGVRNELEALKDLPWALGKKSVETQHEKVLESCGLAFPSGDSQRLFECFLATKAVVHYVGRKLQELESEATRYYELLKLEQKRRDREGVDDG